MAQNESTPLMESQSSSRSSPSFRQRISRYFDLFVDFALKDNILEFAIGLILATAFTALVDSFVSDILLPLVSLLPFINHNFSEKFVILRHASNSTETSYNTVKQALADGAIVWAWGNFVDKAIRLFIVALTLFIIAITYSSVSGDNIVKRQVKCKYCRKWISEKARRCVNCTSWQDGSEHRS